MFFKGSRYAEVGEHAIIDDQGRVCRYNKVRFIPATPAERGHRLAQGERLDHLAQRYFRDPERFWRIGDANLALWPDDLVAEPNRIILIPAPQG
jgi:hypothetical protein